MTTNSRLAGAMLVIVLASSIAGYTGFRTARTAEHNILTEAQFAGLKTAIAKVDLDGMRTRLYQGDLDSK